MGQNQKPRGPQNLAELVDEAKGSLKPDAIDWEKLDASLFARIESESKIETSGVRKSGLSRPNRFGSESHRGWQVAGILAAAAAIALALHRPATSSFDTDRTTQSAHPAALVLTAQGASSNSGDVRIGGEIAAAGRSIRPLDSIETTSAHADFSSLTSSSADDALRVAWRLEGHSQVTVRSLGGGGAPLIIELAAGAVEAQVTPVERGEAFAIDLRANANDSQVGDGAHDVVRIAVHGTHLRVSRDSSGNHASIDLSEGVVSIGFPPKSGSTYGTLVTAPAHVDIDIAKFLAEGPALAGSASDAHAITVDKNPSAVRAPVALTTHAAQNSGPAQNEAVNTVPENLEPTQAQDESHPLATDHTAADRAAPVVDPHAEQTIVAAAKACAAVHESSNEVRVSVSSKLSLHVGADGAVRMARFEPPLTPEAQECAGKTIYKVRFAPAPAAHDVDVAVEVEN